MQTFWFLNRNTQKKVFHKNDETHSEASRQPGLVAQSDLPKSTFRLLSLIYSISTETNDVAKANPQSSAARFRQTGSFQFVLRLWAIYKNTTWIRLREFLRITAACLFGHVPLITPCLCQSRRGRSNRLKGWGNLLKCHLPSPYVLLGTAFYSIFPTIVFRCGPCLVPHCSGLWSGRWGGFCWCGPERPRWLSVSNEPCRFPLKRWPKSPDRLCPDAGLPINSEWQRTGSSGVQNNRGSWIMRMK